MPKLKNFKVASFTTALCLSIMGLSATPGVSATIEFRGGGYLYNFSQGCGSAWPVGGTAFTSVRFRPPRIGDNGSSTRIAFFFSTYATSFVLEKGNLKGNKFKKVIGGSTTSGTFYYDITSKMKATLTPSNITESTENVVVEGTVKGLDWIANCNADFRVTVTQKP